MEKRFISQLHNSTKRDYLQRMINNKVHCMKIAKKYGKDYWDGKRKYGYGGYKYIPGRWKNLAKKLIKLYKLKAGSIWFFFLISKANCRQLLCFLDDLGIWFCTIEIFLSLFSISFVNLVSKLPTGGSGCDLFLFCCRIESLYLFNE